MKDILKSEGFYLSLFVIGAFGLIAWFKGGGDLDWFLAVFFGLILLVIVGLIAGTVAMFVGDYLDEQRNLKKNPYFKFFIVRLVWVVLFALVFFLIIKLLP